MSSDRIRSKRVDVTVIQLEFRATALPGQVFNQWPDIETVEAFLAQARELGATGKTRVRLTDENSVMYVEINHRPDERRKPT